MLFFPFVVLLVFVLVELLCTIVMIISVLNILLWLWNKAGKVASESLSNWMKI